VITKNNEPIAELRPSTLGDFLRLWTPDPDDETFADDLDQANSKELPSPNPWGS
jgi:hypothetical protein